MGIEHHDQVIVMGDLNYRINDLSRQQVIELCNQNKISEIINEDDLTKARDAYNFSLHSQSFENKF